MFLLASVKLALHLLSTGAFAYGYVGDELYYLDCARRLDWGYVDHPPLSIAILAAVRATLGESLLAVRFLPAIAGSVTIVLTGLLCRELRGGRTAQVLSALAVLCAPVFLAMAGFYSMNALEPTLWAFTAWLVARLQNGEDSREWLAVGVAVGLGLLNKWSMAWLGIGLALGLVLSPGRRWWATPWPWAAAVAAGAIFLPNVVWQLRHGWPTLEFIRNVAELKNLPVTPLSFLELQVLAVHPFVVPFWIGGLLYLLFSHETRHQRTLAWIWLVPFGLLLASGSARVYYLAPAYPVLLAAGGRAVERLGGLRGWRWLPYATAGILVAAGITGAPYSIPLLAPQTYVAYERAIGTQPPPEARDEPGQLPLHFALRFHGPALVRAVERAHRSLPPADQERVRVLTTSFHESGAINILGGKKGLPHSIGTHNQYWFWGPGDATADVLIVVAEPDSHLLDYFASVEQVAEIECRWCMSWLRDKAVFVGRGARRPLGEIWPELKSFN